VPLGSLATVHSNNMAIRSPFTVRSYDSTKKCASRRRYSHRRWLERVLALAQKSRHSRRHWLESETLNNPGTLVGLGSLINDGTLDGLGSPRLVLSHTLALIRIRLPLTEHGTLVSPGSLCLYGTLNICGWLEALGTLSYFGFARQLRYAHTVRLRCHGTLDIIGLR